MRQSETAREHTLGFSRTFYYLLFIMHLSALQVNGRLQPLPNPIPTNKPGVEPKRPPKAINVTGLCKLSSTVANYINVSWTVEVGKGFTLSVYFVERLNSTELLGKLKTKGQRNPDYTRAVIKDKLNDTDNEIATTSCKVSLACPLGESSMMKYIFVL